MPRNPLIDRVGRSLIGGGRATRNVATDIRYGHLMGRVPRIGAGTSNSDHQVLRTVFAGRIRPGDVLVDIGCGRGRVLAVLLRTHPAHTVVGIEVDAELASAAARRFRNEPRCRVIAGDAISLLPDEATLLFLFNPFGRAAVERLRDQLEQRPPSRPPLRILYSNPHHLEAFEHASHRAHRAHRAGRGPTGPPPRPRHHRPRGGTGALTWATRGAAAWIGPGGRDDQADQAIHDGRRGIRVAAGLVRSARRPRRPHAPGVSSWGSDPASDSVASTCAYERKRSRARSSMSRPPRARAALISV